MLQNRRHVDKRQEKERKAYKCIVLCKSLHISSIIVVVVIVISFFDKNFREPTLDIQFNSETSIIYVTLRSVSNACDEFLCIL